MTVFLTQNHAKMNFSKLELRGTLVYLFGRSLYPDEAQDMMTVAATKVKNTLRARGFDPTKDFIALIGDPLLIAVSVAAASEMANPRPIKLLKYIKNADEYLEVEMPPVRMPTPQRPALYEIGLIGRE